MNNTQPNWDKEAIQYLAKAPFFVRPLAKRKVEQAAKEQGLSQITREFVEKVRNKTSNV